MNRSEYYSELVTAVIQKQLSNSQEDFEFCCGRSGDYQVIETEILKIIFEKESSLCEIRRKRNDNPVMFRDREGKVFRLHGEVGYLERELTRLSDGDITLLSDNKRFD